MGTTLASALGRVGVWSVALRSDDPALAPAITDAAAELEGLGYGAVWLGASPGVRHAEPLLAATTRLTVATGILPIDAHPAAEVAARAAELDERSGGRFLLGLGVGHGDLGVPPYTAMRAYLDALDAAPAPVPPSRRVLAALGPKMLRLAGERTAGAHPYLVTADHVAQARAVLGDDALLAPELKVVLDPDPARARATARATLARYLSLPNYTRNFLRIGFTEDDIAGAGSDRLVDALVAHGDATAVAARVEEFLAAGADHVALQVILPGGARDTIPLDVYRALAGELTR